MPDWSIGGNQLGSSLNPAQGVLGTVDANALVIETGGTPRLYIDTGGNVGVGTTSPNGRLSLGGAAGVKELVYDGTPIITPGSVPI